MPTQSQLVAHGRSVLAGAITKYHGGMAALAGRLGLEMSYDKLPDQHWEDLKVVERELLLWIDQRGTPGTMPTESQLYVSGRSDLSNGIQKYHRGIKAVTA